MTASSRRLITVVQLLAYSIRMIVDSKSSCWCNVPISSSGSSNPSLSKLCFS